ncbi:deoxycytidine triphosphate deaminase [Thermobaculum terrenum ATCC BAA-798]|uniref:dCTP deaminase, dUMP-forming n=1 Tax=Thermobaculum terrenum (strain ATCC BAA-798 / CCMEE 7001 / YNP1) TaxID=525904 RepID=D1CDK0_THET1|nr:dCTP deaminase [Thermobaculum terrenum]ACZ41006.1 deoxycytidine triphosphate deaminase [Thermobaculum terrenum ATCC BAA-798]
MILSDTMIIDAIKTGWVSFDPPVDIDIQVQPASVDLRLGNTFRVYNYAQQAVIDPTEDIDLDSISQIVRLEDKPFILHPGAFVLGSTMEYVKIPPDLVGRLEGRSSLGRLGVVVHSTAGFIDPGFEGNITLEISNIGKIPVALRAGIRICQLTLMHTGPVARPYGPLRGSKYQGQREPTPSRIKNDVEFLRRGEIKVGES